MFNKGLHSSEKSEELLRRLKNIEDKTDNNLSAIENKINNKLALIGIEKEKSIEFDKRNKDAFDLYQKIKKAIEKIKIINEKPDGGAKLNFPFSRNDFDFSSYTDLNGFNTDI